MKQIQGSPNNILSGIGVGRSKHQRASMISAFTPNKRRLKSLQRQQTVKGLADAFKTALKKRNKESKIDIVEMKKTTEGRRAAESLERL
mmetsp:Transcript_19664/g.30377  ORF Transcript_19664/g.30377 Transcript_19664/m.30377 type:complete len:89 (+) Transcript_19664:434-700(+)